MTTILGLSAFYHDSAAALVRDGDIVAAAQEERFTRKKHDESFAPEGPRDSGHPFGMTTPSTATYVRTRGGPLFACSLCGSVEHVATMDAEAPVEHPRSHATCVGDDQGIAEASS